jgi:hypothetical protein
MTLFEIVESFGVRPEIPLFERSEFRNFLIFLRPTLRFLFVSRQKEKEVETQKIMIHRKYQHENYKKAVPNQIGTAFFRISNIEKRTTFNIPL